jgi:dTDP-4-amino-4,6-dideoxy-D-galactose acyltransferase
MKLTELIWDSNFFGYKVGKMELGGNEELPSVCIDIETYKLIYIFSSQQIVNNQINCVSAQLVDVKLLLAKSVSSNNNQDKSIVLLTKLTDDLIDLAIQSGLYSRFKLDSTFKNNEFERLYTTWISSSIDSNDVVVFGYINNQKLVGFITLSTKNNSADIGLIAVDETQRGMNIGGKLISMADVYAQQNGLTQITVNTQQENSSALKFYIKNGFDILNRTHIYHLWN